ncbi:MAG TPA: nucleotide exchange factor GrpE [Myxococcota bacterium]|nr:nucleotide exchange factor GrpE [Myxococcota bacterium]
MSGTEERTEPEVEEAVEQTEPADGGEEIEGEVVELIIDPFAELQQELNDTKARLRTVSKAYRDLQEEMQAFKMRLERQQALKEEILRGDVVSKLFEPLENLRRSIESMRRGGVEESVLEGLVLVEKAFNDGFANLGLEAVGVEGEIFDPGVHEALTMMPVDDEALDGCVVQVFDVGYRVGTRVIRPARVIIGSFVQPSETAEA